MGPVPCATARLCKLPRKELQLSEPLTILNRNMEKLLSHNHGRSREHIQNQMYPLPDNKINNLS